MIEPAVMHVTMLCLKRAPLRIILSMPQPLWECLRSLMQICHLKEDENPEIRIEETRCA
jgi:hypothetical protein